MGTLVGLVCWLLVASMALYWPSLRWRTVLVVFAALTALGCSRLGLELTRAWWLGDGFAARSENAFLSAWILVLLPLIRRRLDSAVIGMSLLQGLMALAAISLAVDITDIVFTALAFKQNIIATVVAYGLIGALYCVGLILCLIAAGSDFPWDYAPWFAGLLLMLPPLPAALENSPIHTGYGVVLLLITLLLSAFIAQGRCRHHRLPWLGCALVTPMIIGVLIHLKQS